MRRLPALLTIGFAVVTACGKWPDPDPQGGGNIFGIPIPTGDDAGDCGSTCDYEETCLACGGVSVCATYGSTCCDTTVCGPESSCLQCVGEPAKCVDPVTICAQSPPVYFVVDAGEGLVEDAGESQMEDAAPDCSFAGACLPCSEGDSQCIADSASECASTGACVRCSRSSDCPGYSPYCACTP